MATEIKKKGQKFVVTSVTAAFTASVDTLLTEVVADQEAINKGGLTDTDLTAMVKRLLGRQQQILTVLGKDAKVKVKKKA